jgi:mono/diheme cytochrome c family protein
MLALAASIGCTAQPAAPEPPASAESGTASGYELAQVRCSPCHGIAPGLESPHPDAPPFPELARRWPAEYLGEALAEGIAVGHEGAEMPEFVLEPAQIEALTAYLRSLASP